jgi:hypothetical protein
MPAPAYNNISATIPQGILQLDIDPGTLAGPAGYPLPPFKFPQSQAVNLQKGTGAGQFNIVGLDKGTLSAAPRTIDLSAAKDPYGTALNFSKVLALLIWNFSTTAGQNLLVDGTVTNAFSGPFNGIATAKAVVGPSILVNGIIISIPLIFPCLNTGFTADATHKIISLDPGANTFDFQLAALGLSA